MAERDLGEKVEEAAEITGFSILQASCRQSGSSKLKNMYHADTPMPPVSWITLLCIK